MRRDVWIAAAVALIVGVGIGWTLQKYNQPKIYCLSAFGPGGPPSPDTPYKPNC